MNGLTDSGLPAWAAQALGVPMSSDQQFEAVLGAYARSHQRPAPPTAEQLVALKKAQKRANPLHVKAVARRRKRKRGGPK
ncbi:hypothetical protein SEA_OLINDD_99 [Microbacterium phage OlinDD]|nr:hypothetical protein SEA_OLINDD_99 [Microbacterium phage OlinDD]AWY05922.1 hypothetical protein SEA_PIONEER3_99 [Microbacterium phage Pioneer3]